MCISVYGINAATAQEDAQAYKQRYSADMKRKIEHEEMFMKQV
jgi:hypothetical protein